MLLGCRAAGEARSPAHDGGPAGSSVAGSSVARGPVAGSAVAGEPLSGNTLSGDTRSRSAPSDSGPQRAGPSRPRLLAPELDREFYRRLSRAPLELPDGVGATQLVRDLQRWLGDRDPELRDTFAHGLPAVWIRRGLVEESALVELVSAWRANLAVGVGETGGDGVLLRSFSALALDSVLSRESRRPFLEARVVAGLTLDLVRYLERERDLRGYEPELGWVHATAHAADALARCVRHPAVDDATRWRVVDAIEARLDTVEAVFTHGENRRLALVLAAIVAREESDVEPIVAWRARAREREKELWAAPVLDLRLFARVENETQVFESLLAALTALPAEHSNARRVRNACAAE